MLNKVSDDEKYIVKFFAKVLISVLIAFAILDMLSRL